MYDYAPHTRLVSMEVRKPPGTGVTDGLSYHVSETGFSAKAVLALNHQAISCPLHILS